VSKERREIKRFATESREDCPSVKVVTGDGENNELRNLLPPLNIRSIRVIKSRSMRGAKVHLARGSSYMCAVH
jgi:hypothetical protein